MDSEQPKLIVERFWMAMQSNDFKAAGQVLHDDYILDWPQSGERIRGRSNFVAVNENYPAHGRWEFTLHRLLADGNEVVSDVEVTDGVLRGRAITFSTVQDGRIRSQVEFWPDPYEPADWRKEWVERIDTEE
jgi:ketosteroid isomerase-like protein